FARTGERPDRPLSRVCLADQNRCEEGLRGLASLTLSTCPWTSRPSSPVIAARASAASVYSTKPKPFDSPLERSVATLAERTFPYGTARSFSCASVTCLERFPTCNFIGAPGRPCRRICRARQSEERAHAE